MRRLPPLLLAASLGACVSLEESPMADYAIQNGQRVLIVAYAPPSPFIVEDDSKAEFAAKVVPGLGLVVKDAQDQRDLKASLDLQQYLPPWKPAELFLSSFTLQVARLGIPGTVIEWKDTTVPPAAQMRLNKAADMNDWRAKFYDQLPDRMVGRNYSAFLELDDVAVLEVNLAPTLETDGEGNFTPALYAVTKLLRANTMRQLWRREHIVNEPGAAQNVYEFKTKPETLIYAWNRLMPMLGLKIVDDLRLALQAAKVPLAPPASNGPSPGGPNYLPSGPGWGPAAAAESPAPRPYADLPPVEPFAPRASTP